MIVQSKKWPYATDGWGSTASVCFFHIPGKDRSYVVRSCARLVVRRLDIKHFRNCLQIFRIFSFLWYHFWQIYWNYLSLEELINTQTQTHNFKHITSNEFAKNSFSTEQMDYSLPMRNVRKDEPNHKVFCSPSILKRIFLRKTPRAPL